MGSARGEVRGKCTGHAWNMRGKCVGSAWEVHLKHGGKVVQGDMCQVSGHIVWLPAHHAEKGYEEALQCGYRVATFIRYVRKM